MKYYIIYDLFIEILGHFVQFIIDDCELWCQVFDLFGSVGVFWQFTLFLVLQHLFHP